MKIIEEVTKEQLKEQLKNIDLTDQNLYKEVNNNQFGIFQFSGNTASGMIKEAKVNNFNDLVSINALSRPGASFGFDNFCNNVDGKSKYPEQIAKYLKDSRGCILFQEQIMSTFSDTKPDDKNYGNYIRGLLKKLGKKNKKQEDLDAWNKESKNFSEFYEKEGIPKETIDMILNDILTLSAYSFNKSHAAAYSYLAIETIYLAKYFRAPFYSANLSYQAGKKDALKEAIKSVRQSGFKVLPPDVNKSMAHFSPEREDLRFGLGEIKGIGEIPLDNIIKNRPYSSIIDFVCKNITEKGITKRVTSSLIGGGAFDELIEKDSRKKYFNIATEFYEKKKTKKNPELLKELWDEIEKNHSLDIVTDMEDYMNFEKDYLDGSFFHGMFSPEMVGKIEKLWSLHKSLRNFVDVRNNDLNNAMVPVEIKSFKYCNQKNGKQMVFLNIEDSNGEQCSVPVFASYWEYCKLKFFAEGFYFLSLYDKEGKMMFGSRSFITDPDRIRRMMIKWTIK